MAGAGQLQHSDLLWRQGMPNWQPAVQVQGLFPAMPPVPPVPGANTPGANVPFPPGAGAAVPFAQALPYGGYTRTGESHNGTAITAFVLSIVGLFVCAIGLEPAALALSYTALSGMKSSGNDQGKGLAIAARVIAIIGLIGWAIWTVYRAKLLGTGRW